MKVVFLNGNSGTDGGHRVSLISLCELDIHPCMGCFGCWFKTPGECCIRNDFHTVNRAVTNSDFTLWASPLVMDFPSALLKNNAVYEKSFAAPCLE